MFPFDPEMLEHETTMVVKFTKVIDGLDTETPLEDVKMTSELS